VVCIAEGYATGASIHAATGYAVAVAFNAGNLGPVVGAIRENHSEVQFIVCADDDAGTPGNPGLTHARDAARAVCALLAAPLFGTDRLADATDFNDLHQARGIGSVRDSISAATVVGGGDAGLGSARHRMAERRDGDRPALQTIVPAARPAAHLWADGSARGIARIPRARRHAAAQHSPSSRRADARGWRKTDAGGSWRSIRRCSMTGSEVQGLDFGADWGCYCC